LSVKITLREAEEGGEGEEKEEGGGEAGAASALLPWLSLGSGSPLKLCTLMPPVLELEAQAEALAWEELLAALAEACAEPPAEEEEEEEVEALENEPPEEEADEVADA
jgi:hypothetical protein